jgi:hypothetical protein
MKMLRTSSTSFCTDSAFAIHFITALAATLPETICDTKEKKIEYHPVQKLSRMWTGAIHFPASVV